MLERYHNIGGHLRLDPEGTLTSYADAHATIADIQGQAKDYQACRDVLDSTVLELTQVQQRVAQLEALLDTHKTEYRAVLQSKAKEIDEIQADYMRLQADHARVLAALKPFAERWEYFERTRHPSGTWPGTMEYADDEPSAIYLGQLKAAKEALAASLPAQRAKLAQGGASKEAMT